MNRIFKTVWNRVRRCYVAVNETITGAKQASGKTALAVSLVLSSVSTSSLADVYLWGWDHYTKVPSGGWVNDINNKNYGNDSTTVTLTSNHSFDNMAIGRRSGSHIYGGNIPWEDSTTGMAAAPSGQLTAGGNLVIEASAKVDVANTLYLFGCGFVDRTAHDHDGADDCAGFGQDIVINGGQLTVGNVLDLGKFNVSEAYMGHCTYYTDWNELRLNKGASVVANDIDGAAHIFVTGGSTLTSNNDLGSIRKMHGYNQGTLLLSDHGSLVNTKNFNSNIFVNANNGATLNVDFFNLTSPTYTSTNAFLRVPLEQISDLRSSHEMTTGLLICLNDAHKTLDAANLGASNVISALLGKFTNNTKFSGGGIHLKGTYTQSIANKATQLIQGKYGSNVKVTFDKIIPDPLKVDYSQGLTAQLANAIIAENNQDAQKGVVFTEHRIDALTTGTTVGAQANTNNINTSVGFKWVNGNADITVTGGKELVFLGENAGRTIASGKLIADNGVLRLGTSNTSVAIGGTVADVDLLNNGTFETERGAFVANDVTGTGHVLVTSGVLNVNTLNIAGNVTNRGTLNLANGATWTGGHNAGTLSTAGFTASGSFSNANGVWNLGAKPTFLAGTQINNENGTLKTAFGNLFDNGTGAELDGLHTISRQAVVPQEIRETLTDLFTKYVPGSVKEDVLAHMTFNGDGKVVITNANLTTTQRDDLVKAFKEKIVAF